MVANTKGKDGQRPSLPDGAEACTGMQSPAKKRVRLPKLGVHKATGQARVLLSGVTHYCGVAGTPEAHARYAELVQKWLADGKRPMRDLPTAPQAVVTLRGVFDAFLAHADSTGRYQKNGKPGTHRQRFDALADSIVKVLGNLPVAKLTEALLVRWRDTLEQPGRRGMRTRLGINRLVAMAVLVLRWGKTRGLVPKAVFADLSAIEPLQRGQCGDRPDHGRPRRAVSAEEAEKVAQHACPQVAAMIRLQAMTGMRPSEVCGMRWADIDKTPMAGDATGSWVYRVPTGKTSHHGHATRYVLPPVVQKILEQFPALPAAFIFSPAKAMAERRQRLRAARKTPPTGQTHERDATADRNYSPRWGTNEYRHAVERAAKAAKVERFTPHELRHGFVTWAANTLTIGAAAAAANHRSATTTNRYVHVRHDDALAVAAAMQARVTG